MAGNFTILQKNLFCFGNYSALSRNVLDCTVISTNGTTCMDAGGRAPTVGALGDAGAVAEKS